MVLYWNIFKKILELRDKYDAFESGKLEILDIFKDNEIYQRAFAFLLTTDNQKILVVANFFEDTILDFDFSGLTKNEYKLKETY